MAQSPLPDTITGKLYYLPETDKNSQVSQKHPHVKPEVYKHPVVIISQQLDPVNPRAAIFTITSRKGTGNQGKFRIPISPGNPRPETGNLVLVFDEIWGSPLSMSSESFVRCSELHVVNFDILKRYRDNGMWELTDESYRALMYYCFDTTPPDSYLLAEDFRAIEIKPGAAKKAAAFLPQEPKPGTLTNNTLELAAPTTPTTPQQSPWSCPLTPEIQDGFLKAEWPEYALPPSKYGMRSPAPSGHGDVTVKRSPSPGGWSLGSGLAGGATTDEEDGWHTVTRRKHQSPRE